DPPTAPVGAGRPAPAADPARRRRKGCAQPGFSGYSSPPTMSAIKTLTEFSPSLLQRARQIRAEHLAAHEPARRDAQDAARPLGADAPVEQQAAAEEISEGGPAGGPADEGGQSAAAPEGTDAGPHLPPVAEVEASPAPAV